ncbi:mechanosensitive ion channel [Candidatus Woesearchaeota archaeon]|nr:mechanosensitive ion channel [Candidatus Woesearchaeota archaeon]
MEWVDLFHLVTNKIAVTVLIVLVGFIIGRIVGRLIFRILHELEIDNLVKKANSSVEQSISQVFEYVIYVITVCIALDNLGILAYVLIISVAVVVFVIILSALLGFKDFIPNFLCGLWLRKKNSMYKNNYVSLGNVKGKVVSKGLVGIKIQTKSKDIISIPNLTILKKKWK